MGMFAFGLLLLLGLHVSYSSQCDCNASCAIYTSPVQCVRCCTHYVKRSLPLHPAHRKQKFLLENSLNNHRKIKHPIWKKYEPIESTLPRFIRLLMQNPL
ncbi:hypothetical protein CAEBREN_00823 [Caenorhabditis brenneri]|uniref:Secreted protein n=1 Tax=Caenorhabditis brenneri TaxID=135651 RepID=G0MNQ2_CAEBE|nr:hypothetical protein CAEBREN_00823 [Caenorhabditis brenneri]